MNPPGDKPPAPPRPFSIHRAFVYAVGMPGWGELYAKAKLRGLITIGVTLLFVAWFFLALIQSMQAALGMLSLDPESGTMASPDFPVWSLGLSIFGLNYAWLWGTFSAVQVAVQHRKALGLAPQKSPLWGTLMAWFNPATGPLYAEKTSEATAVFVAYLLAIPLQILAYAGLAQKLTALVRSGSLPTDAPEQLAQQVSEHVRNWLADVNFGFGTLALTTVRYVAIALTLRALMKPSKEPQSGILWALGAAIVGYLCPGGGQFLMGRALMGWLTLGAYLGFQLLITVLLQSTLIGPGTADFLDWGLVLIQWGALLEASIRTLTYPSAAKASTN